MEVAHIHVSGTQAHPGRVQPITAGIVGAVVRMSYTDDPWDGLIRNVVFRHEGKSVVILNAGKTVQLPAELVAEPSREPVFVGVCGVDANDTVLIPTLWAKIGPVNPSPSLSGEPAADPSLPIWAQLQQADARIEQKADSAKITADMALAANPDWSQNDPDKPDYVKNRTHYVETFGGGAERVHPLPEKFIPETIARKDAVTRVQQIAEKALYAVDNFIPLVAEVGQTIVVNAVDENGKPVSWRAVDLPTGGGSAGSGGIWSTVAEFTYNQNTELSVDSYDEESKHLHFTTAHGLAVGDVLLFPVDLDKPGSAIRSATNGYAEVTEVIDAQTVICANVLAVPTDSLPAKVEKSAGRVLFVYKDKITKPYARLRIEGTTIHYGNLWTFSKYYSSYGPDRLLDETAGIISSGFSIVQIVPGYGVGRAMIARVHSDSNGNKHIDRIVATVSYTANYSPVPREHIMTPQLVFNGLKVIVEEADTWEIP